MLSKYPAHGKCSKDGSLVKELSSSLARHLYLSSPETEMCHFPAMSYYFHVGHWTRIHCFIFVFMQRWMDVSCSLPDFQHGILALD